MTHEDYVSFEQAQKLKELRFDWSCETFWDDEGSPKEHQWVIKNFHDYSFVTNSEDCTVMRPTLYQAVKWIMEKFGLLIQVCTTYYRKYKLFDIELFDMHDHHVSHRNFQGFETYEKAMTAGINLAILEIESRLTLNF